MSLSHPDGGNLNSFRPFGKKKSDQRRSGLGNKFPPLSSAFNGSGGAHYEIIISEPMTE